MSTAESSPASAPAPAPAARCPGVLAASFEELYERHLCRHAQWGNNAIHLVAVLGAYFGAFGLACGLAGGRWPLLAAAGLHLAVIARRIPWRLVATIPVLVALLYVLLGAAPALPLWAYPVAGFASYKLQNVGHLVDTVERDMSRFAAKYPKGPGLTRLLLVYEMPILIEFLVFDRRSGGPSAAASS
jgi:hypothetical protein